MINYYLRYSGGTWRSFILEGIEEPWYLALGNPAWAVVMDQMPSGGRPLPTSIILWFYNSVWFSAISPACFSHLLTVYWLLPFKMRKRMRILLLLVIHRYHCFRDSLKLTRMHHQTILVDVYLLPFSDLRMSTEFKAWWICFFSFDLKCMLGPNKHSNPNKMSVIFTKRLFVIMKEYLSRAEDIFHQMQLPVPSMCTYF